MFSFSNISFVLETMSSESSGRLTTGSLLEDLATLVDVELDSLARVILRTLGLLCIGKFVASFTMFLSPRRIWNNLNAPLTLTSVGFVLLSLFFWSTMMLIFVNKCTTILYACLGFLYGISQLLYAASTYITNNYLMTISALNGVVHVVGVGFTFTGHIFYRLGEMLSYEVTSLRETISRITRWWTAASTGNFTEVFQYEPEYRWLCDYDYVYHNTPSCQMPWWGWFYLKWFLALSSLVIVGVLLRGIRFRGAAILRSIPERMREYYKECVNRFYWSYRSEFIFKMWKSLVEKVPREGDFNVSMTQNFQEVWAVHMAAYQEEALKHPWGTLSHALLPMEEVKLTIELVNRWINEYRASASWTDRTLHSQRVQYLTRVLTQVHHYADTAQVSALVHNALPVCMMAEAYTDEYARRCKVSALSTAELSA